MGWRRLSSSRNHPRGRSFFFFLPFPVSCAAHDSLRVRRTGYNNLPSRSRATTRAEDKRRPGYSRNVFPGKRRRRRYRGRGHRTASLHVVYRATRARDGRPRPVAERKTADEVRLSPPADRFTRRRLCKHGGVTVATTTATTVRTRPDRLVINTILTRLVIDGRP